MVNVSGALLRWLDWRSGGFDSFCFRGKEGGLHELCAEVEMTRWGRIDGHH